MNDTLASVGLWTRMLIFVAVLMLGIALPGGTAVGLICTAPSEYVIVKEELPEMNKIFVASDNHDTEFCVIELPSVDAAKAKLNAVYESTDHIYGVISVAPTSSSAQYKKKDGDFTRLLSVENYVIDIEAKDEKELDKSLKSFKFIKENPNKNLVLEFFKKDLRVTGGIIAGYYVLLFFAMIPLTSWVAAVGGNKKNAKLDSTALQDRLLELNQLDLPFQVVQAKNGVIVAEWKFADAKWAGVMQANGVKSVDKLLLRLDPESSTVRAVVDTRTISWTEGSGKTALVPKMLKGINFFQFNKEQLQGLSYKEGGWKPTTNYNYKFNLGEMRSPLIQAITDGGWAFKPVVTFVRLIGG